MPENPFAPDPNLKVWLDGKLIPVNEARISVFDHGVLYGDGIFEGIRVYNRRIFREADHIRRCYESAKAIRLAIPISPEQMRTAMRETVDANRIVDGYIRLLVTRGVGVLGISPLRTANPSVVIIAATIQLYPPEFYEKGLDIITASTIRNHPDALSPHIKSMNYLNNIMAKLEALDAGCIEAVMLNHQGYVAECTGDNLFIVRDGKLTTPPPSAGILIGVTRQVVMDLAGHRGLPCFEHNLIRTDLYRADECFLTGTAAEIVPVVSIDRRKIGDGKPGPITRQLMADFAELRSHVEEDARVLGRR